MLAETSVDTTHLMTMAQVEEVQSEYQIDPVCGMKVLPEKAAGSMEHAGRMWYFCGKGCLARLRLIRRSMTGRRLKLR
jgi:YHS domain-containing protein